MTTEVRVPALGESVTEATIATWFKKPGDRVEVDEMLCELETDKVTVEVPSPAAGTLAEIVAAEDVTACKPDPQGFNRALERLEIEPRRCVVVEDSLPGLAAARAAGLHCAVLTTSHPTESFAGADLVWSDFVGRRPSELPWSHA